MKEDKDTGYSSESKNKPLSVAFVTESGLFSVLKTGWLFHRPIDYSEGRTSSRLR